MAQPYVGEIRMFAGNFAPAGWQFCDGTPMQISEYETLFQLIGTTYGGDGESTFCVPDLRGRIPLHQGNGFVLGETGGVEQVTLTAQQIPAHNHSLLASTALATEGNAAGNVFAQSNSLTMYRAGTASSALAAGLLSSTGGSQPHMNMQPYVCVGFIISLFGIFPQQT